MSSVIRAVRKYPVKSEAVRKELVRDETCPQCGHELDTGWECTNRKCRFDAALIAKKLAIVTNN